LFNALIFKKIDDKKVTSTTYAEAKGTRFKDTYDSTCPSEKNFIDRTRITINGK